MKKIICPCCGKELIDLSLPDNPSAFWCDECDLDVVLNSDSETPVFIADDTVKVEWVNLDEGVCGDYHPDDPDDINLLRFDVSVANKDLSTAVNPVWDEVEDASYCTCTPAETDPKILIRLLYAIFKEYRSKISGYPEVSLKKLGEGLSWISPADIK